MTGYVQYGPGVLVTAADAEQLHLDEIIYGHSFIKPSGDDPALHVRIDPRLVPPTATEESA